MVKYVSNVLVLLYIAALPVTAQVGIGTKTPHPSAQLDVNSTTKGFLPPRMDSNQRNAIVSPAQGLTIYNTSREAFECFNGTAWYSTVHFIGESYSGGTVFYVYDNGQHGLIVSPASYNGDVVYRWSAGTNIITMASAGGNIAYDGMAIKGGIKNTEHIIANQGYGDGGNYAALYCSNYRNPSTDAVQFEDWYMPSLEELYLLWLQKGIIGDLEFADYFSSTEGDIDDAWVMDFYGGIKRYRPKDYSMYVRPIRAF